MKTEDLWGDLGLQEEIDTPASILKKQAALLSERTNNIVQARVVPRISVLHQRSGVPPSAPGRGFEYDFDLVVPPLEGYIYTLLRIEHDVSLYPVSIYEIFRGFYPSGSGDGLVCMNEEEYLANLGAILSSDDVHAIIRSLVGQARAVG